MSQFTDYAENKLADYVRGQGLPLPSVWGIAAGSAADDSSFTELSGSGLARAVVTLNLTNFCGTQGAGSTLASTGTSHMTSNNVLIDMGTATAAIGTVTHIGFFDQSSGGNCWIWVALAAADQIVTANGVPVQVAIGRLVLTLGLSGGMSNYLSNQLIDKIFRGQTYDWPASTYLKAMTAAPTNAGGGTEVGGGVGYARKEIVSSLAEWSGTQGAGTTVASSGTAARISNNNQLVFADPTGAWGAIGWLGLDDASSAGNPLFWGAMSAAKTIGIGRPLVCAANSIGLTWA